MNPRRIFILLTTICAAAAAAVTPLARLQQRADRFFDQKEWAQASATYYQMLDQRPDQCLSTAKPSWHAPCAATLWPKSS